MQANVGFTVYSWIISVLNIVAILSAIPALWMAYKQQNLSLDSRTAMIFVAILSALRMLYSTLILNDDIVVLAPVSPMLLITWPRYILEFTSHVFFTVAFCILLAYWSSVLAIFIRPWLRSFVKNLMVIAVVWLVAKYIVMAMGWFSADVELETKHGWFAISSRAMDIAVYVVLCILFAFYVVILLFHYGDIQSARARRSLLMVSRCNI